MSTPATDALAAPEPTGYKAPTGADLLDASEAKEAGTATSQQLALIADWEASAAAAELAERYVRIRDNMARALSTPQGLAQAPIAWDNGAQRRRMYAWARERVARRGLRPSTVVPSETSARTGARPRGAGRPSVNGASRRSNARSGDSGDPDEPEPPGSAGRRLCGCGCRESIEHLAPQARYVNDTHRKRGARAQEWAEEYTTAPPSALVVDVGAATRFESREDLAGLMTLRPREDHKGYVYGRFNRGPEWDWWSWRTRPRRGFAQRNPLVTRWERPRPAEVTR